MELKRVQQHILIKSFSFYVSEGSCNHTSSQFIVTLTTNHLHFIKIFIYFAIKNYRILLNLSKIDY